MASEITLETDSAEGKRVRFAPDDDIYDVATNALCGGGDYYECQNININLGNEFIEPGHAFFEYGIEDGGRLGVQIITSPDQSDVERFRSELCELNSRNEGEIQRRPLDVDGLDLDLSELRLDAVPDSITTYPFGSGRNCLCTLKQLNLSRNNLSTLPDNFGELHISGILDLSHNPISTLPSTFVALQVGGVKFKDCKQLQEIDIPETVVQIEESAFENCESLTRVVIPESVEKIKDAAFQNCVKLETVNIPDTVEEIGAIAFERCASLTNVFIPSKITEIEEGTFRGCEKLAEIVIPSNVKTIWDYAFAECVALEEIRFEGGVERIMCEAFYGCKLLKGIVIPPSIRDIDYHAFRDCENLEYAVIPTKTKDLCNLEDAFVGCHANFHIRWV